MKNIVIADAFATKDFKPSGLLGEYLSLTAGEIDQFFPLSKRMKVPCPACGANASQKAFERFGFNYDACEACGTLYVNPRPDDNAIVQFYQRSSARKFWNTQLYPATSVRRQEKIINPRFQWVEDSVSEYLPKAKAFADCYANQSAYIASIVGLSSFSRRTLIHPLVPVKVPLEGVEVIDAPLSRVDGQWDVITLFEALDHASDMAGLMQAVNARLTPGGLCFITAILGSGFDVQTLWGRAGHIHPPDRLNLLTVDGIHHLAGRHRFEILELSTPGILDVSIVAQALIDDLDLPLGRFEKNLIDHRDEGVRANFQAFLQQNLLSSYGRILLRKIE